MMLGLLQLLLVLNCVVEMVRVDQVRNVGIEVI